MAVILQNDSRTYKLFVASLRSEHTRKTYLVAIADFMEYASISSIDELVSIEPKRLQDMLIDFTIDKRKVWSYASVSTKLAGLRRLCTIADVELNWKKVCTFLGEHTKTVKDRIYTREELQNSSQMQGSVAEYSFCFSYRPV